MLTLSLSTSSVRGSLCLGKNGNILADVSWQKETSHSEIITSALEALFKKAKVSLSQVERVVCGQGPGSFTGLRVGLSVARTIAYTQNCPIYALNDCWGITVSAPPQHASHQLVLLDAQKNKIFAAIYFHSSTDVQEILAPQLLNLEDLAPLLTQETYSLRGDAKVFLPLLPSSIQNKITKQDVVDSVTEANALYRFVNQKAPKLKPVSWLELLPLYIRASAAEEVAAEKSSRKY